MPTNAKSRVRRAWRQTSIFCLAMIMTAAVVVFAGPAHGEPAGSILIPGWAFDRGNLKTFTQLYGTTAAPMVANGGTLPNVAEYDIDFPVDAEYAFFVNFAASTSRPIELSVDGNRVASVCGSTTGSWDTSSAKFVEQCKLKLSKGKHTIKMLCSGPYPHVVSLRFDSPAAFPAGWKLSRPKARKLDAPPPIPQATRYSPTETNIDALRSAVANLTEKFGPRYPQGAEYLKRIDELEARQTELQEAASQGEADTAEQLKTVNEALVALQREALLGNPLLDFDRLLLVKRGARSPSLGLPRNWQSNSSLPKSGFDDSIEVLPMSDLKSEFETLFKPEGGKFVGDVDLDFDAQKMLFSMPGSHNRWQIFEIGADGSGLRELTGEQPDVDSYDACYLPGGRIMITSTGCFVGVPCVYGSSHVAVLYVMDADGKNIRQLGFDQEHDWCPTVLHNGRVLYSRWEYTDTPHSNTRLLFHMNPDGTEQMEFYGSNSYWPNSFFYTRPVPGHSTKVVSVIGGHHDNPRMGELVIFDPAVGRRESSGAVQRIPGHGKKVETIISDGLTKSSWPKFLHPYPLSENYIITACKPTPQSLWGIYLVDTFDNIVLLREEPGFALLEPVPFRPTTRPPAIPDKVDLARKDAVVYISDIYAGDGLKGIPRGTVKEMRVFTYHFAYQGMGGLLGVVGMDGPWDIKRVIGTVPVEPDGSAKFRIPANTPVSLQPLDDEGKAVQLMRSWMTGMPGEVVQCAGCHESQNSAPRPLQTIALRQRPVDIKPWHGPTRGFSYPREVQVPVIDKYCVGCHNGQPQADGTTIADLRGTERIKDWKLITAGNGGNRGGKFSVGYAELHRFVRRPGIESDYHMLNPMEYHADTTQLIQMLKKGHHNVKLDAEAWDRLITWIDLNCPYHGTWGEELANPGVQRQRRRELLQLYGGIDDDPEAVPEMSDEPVEFVAPQPLPTVQAEKIACPDWPLTAEQAKALQAAAGTEIRRTIQLAEGMTIEMVLIPAGEFVMGSTDGAVDERPRARVRIEKPFWMSVGEVSNAQFAVFDPTHNSRVETKNAYQFGIHGYPMNQPEQPAVRVTNKAATAFCRWLSKKAGQTFTLPSEAQWEYAARAGTATPFSYGDLDTDFSKFANLGDAKMVEFVTNPYTVFSAYKNPPKYDDWIPKETRFNDGSLLTVAPCTYEPNAWGLHDMHGNAAEWTRTAYRAYPYVAEDGRDAADGGERKVVRGGSWRDRPMRCTSSFRLGYQPHQGVYNVGFRLVCPAGPEIVAVK